MDFVVYDEPDAFWTAVAGVYEADPIRHTTALTVLAGLRATGTDGFADPLLVGISDAGSVVGAAFCTPPEYRRRGYGAAVTASVSGWALDNGADDVVLFTDLANPTSNSIYQQIGYAPVYNAVEYRFAGS